MILFMSGIAMAAYTFDSEIDPAEFRKWTIIKKVRTGLNQGQATLENPDRNARIKVVIMTMSNHWLMAYEYVIDGKKFKYERNFDTEHFGLVKPAGTTSEMVRPWV